MLIVQTSSGKLRGAEEDGICVFRGIPYARPPVGPLRYCPPEAPEPWPGVRDATRFGPAAPQDSGALGAVMGLGIGRTSEDCLTLNVWTPAPDAGRRPVMVWIHGGAFILGAGSQMLYHGATLARRGDLVVVTVNYRLGALGFLRLRAADGSLLATGNEGLLDQIAALQWVQREIAAFGGDPHRVTIFGESAGAMSCATLLGTPRAQGLFQRAILQSGAANYLSTAQAAQDVAENFLREMNLDPDDPGAVLHEPAARIVGGQRRFFLGLLLRPKQVFAGNFLAPRRIGFTLFFAFTLWWRLVRRLALFAIGWLRDRLRPGPRRRGRLRALLRPLFTPASDEAELPFEPVLDGDLLPEHPLDAIGDGLALRVPVLVGTNVDEQKLFAFLDPQAQVLTEKALLERCERIFAGAGRQTRDLAHEAVQTYRRAREERGERSTPGELWFAIETDRTMRSPAMRLAALHSVHQPDTYAYLFGWRSPFLGGSLGACHALELPFVFGTLDHPMVRGFAGSRLPGAQDLAAQIQDSWIAFARSGRPAHAGIGDWPAYEPGRRTTMILDRHCRAEPAPRERERAFWDALG